jgi:hypothetical protein
MAASKSERSHADKLGASPNSTEAKAFRRHAVWVDNFTRRTGDDALSGHFARVVGGDHEGKYGVFVEALTADKDGFPDDVLFRTRDDRQELLTVKYKDLRPDESGKR